MACELNPLSSVSKKGVGICQAGRAFDRGSAGVNRLGCGWYYNWTSEPDARATEIQAEFIPMIWNGAEATAKKLARLKKNGGTTLLTFNEPDGKKQANMTVGEALACWPRLMRSGMRLGSPAPAVIKRSRDWLARFMEGADAKGYRVDFVCLHWYGDVTAPDAVEQLKDFLDGQRERFRLPIWLTEFSGSSGRWLKLRKPPITAAKNAAFLRKALPMLESLPYLERYAWFELAWTKAPWATVALVDPQTGKITAPGRVFQAAKY